MEEWDEDPELDHDELDDAVTMSELELVLEAMLEEEPSAPAPVPSPAPSTRTPAARREPAVARLLRLLRALAAAESRGLDGPTLLAVAAYEAGTQKSAMSSLQRDVRRLEDAGWYIDNVAPEGSTGQYVLRPNDLAARAGLTPGEQSALEAGLAARTAHTVEAVQGAPESFAVVRRAVDRHCVIEMTYNGTLRRVHPMRLHNPPGRWLLRARDEHDGAVKWFLLHKIEDPSLEDPGTADHPIDDPEDSLNPHRWLVDAPIDVELLVAPEHVPFVRRSTDLAVRERPDNDDVRVVMTVTNRRALTDWLVTMGERVRLVGPEDLRHEFLARLEAVARG